MLLAGTAGLPCAWSERAIVVAAPLFAAADTVIEVTAGVVLGVTVGVANVEKSRDGKTGEQFPFRLEIVNLGVDSDGDPVTTCVVVATEGSFGMAGSPVAASIPARKAAMLASMAAWPLRRKFFSTTACIASGGRPISAAIAPRATMFGRPFSILPAISVMGSAAWRG